MKFESSLYYNFNCDERLFGNKRILLVEQLSCKKNKEIRDKILRKKISAALDEAAKNTKAKRQANANWIIVSSDNLNFLPDFLTQTEENREENNNLYNNFYEY